MSDFSDGQAECNRELDAWLAGVKKREAKKRRISVIKMLSRTTIVVLASIFILFIWQSRD